MAKQIKLKIKRKIDSKCRLNLGFHVVEVANLKIGDDVIIEVQDKKIVIVLDNEKEK